MSCIDFISPVHQSTKRDYLSRVLAADKAECAVVAKKFDSEYFDGDRKYGYGGYHYDGRWLRVTDAIAAHYQLKPDTSILDIGCGKGFLLHDFKQVRPSATIAGLDISSYAIEHALTDVKPVLKQGSAVSLPYADKSFDLVVAINVLHNLRLYDLEKALREIERVAKAHKYIVVDAYRNEREKVNLLYWQLTCECFFTPQEWEWIFQRCGYSGDYGFVFFE